MDNKNKEIPIVITRSPTLRDDEVISNHKYEIVTSPSPVLPQGGTGEGDSQ